MASAVVAPDGDATFDRRTRLKHARARDGMHSLVVGKASLDRTLVCWACLCIRVRGLGQLKTRVFTHFSIEESSKPRIYLSPT